MPTKSVLMLVDRPASPTAKYAKGTVVTIDEALADYYISTGAARTPDARRTVYEKALGGDDGSREVTALSNDLTGGIAYPEIQRGISTVLLGDSLMVGLLPNANPTALSYDSGTGVMTITKSSHGYYTGQPQYFSIKDQPHWNHFHVPAVRIDGDTLSLQLTPGLTLPAGQPLGEVWFGATNYIRSENPFGWLAARRPKLLRVCGVVGENAAAIRRRVSQALAPQPTVVELRAGTNDIGVTEVDSVLSDIDGMVREIVSSGVVCILHTVPPLGAPTAAQSRWIVDVNRRIKALVGKYPNLRICDDYAAIVDPASALGAALSGALNADNIHFVAKAGRLISKKLQICYDSIFPTVSQHPVSVIQAYDATNNPDGFDAFGNGLLATTTGGTASTNVTGTVAAGLVVQGTASTCPVVASVVDAAVGKAQRAVGTPSANNATFNIRASSLHARCTPGEKRRFQAHIKTSGIPANGKVKNLSMIVNMTADGVQYFSVRALFTPQLTEGLYMQEDIDMDVETEPFEIPLGSLTNIQPQIQVDFAGGGSAVTLDVSQFAFVREI